MFRGVLTRQLLLLLLAGLALALVTQVLTRTQFEIPSLLQLERELDLRDVRLARNALRQRVVEIVIMSSDYSVWNDTYDFVQSESGSKLHSDYMESNLAFSTFENYNINGFLFLNLNGDLHHYVGYDLSTGKVLDYQPFDIDKLGAHILRKSKIPGQLARVEMVNAGLFRSSEGPLLFSTVQILPTNTVGESRGFVVAWRWFDQGFVKEIEQQLQRSVSFHSIEFARSSPVLSEYLSRLEALGKNAVIERSQDADLYWLVRTVDNESLYLVRQTATARLFNANWWSRSVLVGFGASALVLMAFGYLFSRMVTRPLDRNGKVLQSISTSNDYSQRLETRHVGEIGRLFGNVNELLVCIQTQEMELRARNRHLEVLSHEDALTGVANRRHLDEFLETAWERSREAQESISICLVDIDRFKYFNDNYGHQSGDRVIRQVAQCLDSNLHAATDFLARYGGEEFCLVLRKTDNTSARRVCERLRRTVEDLDICIQYSDEMPVLTISIGIASTVPDGDGGFNELLYAADQALYQAKRDGRNRVCCDQSDQA